MCILCDHRFDDPAKTEYYDKAFWASYWKKHGKRIDAIATAVAEHFHNAYMSGVGVVTMCRKCAFLWDEMGMHLCPECRIRYCHPGNAACKVCSPPDAEIGDSRLTFEIDATTNADIEKVFEQGFKLLRSLLKAKPKDPEKEQEIQPETLHQPDPDSGQA